MDKSRPLAVAILGIAALLLLAPLAGALSSIYLPAVDLNGQGSLTNATMQAIPGSGRVLLDITPYFTVDTQQSVRTAVAEGAALAGVNFSNYDVIVQITTPAESVDGPSGGAALTLLAYTEFTGKHLRTDFTMTGTINGDGSIGAVGGVYEKAEAASQEEMKVFLVPAGESFQNGLDLTTYAPKQWGMQVIEVANMSQVIAIAFTPTGSVVNATTKVSFLPIPLTPLNATYAGGYLSQVASATIAKATSEFNYVKEFEPGLLQGTDEEALDTQLNDSSRIEALGYAYSAANEAFLVETQLDALNYTNQSASEMFSEVEAMQAMANAMVPATKTPSNMEWAASGDLRYYWAQQALENAATDLTGASPDLQSDSTELATASGWLEAASQLWSIAQTMELPGEAPITETNARELSNEEIQTAQAQINQSDSPNPEAQTHLESAAQEFSSGAYLAAGLDAAYAYAFQASSDDYPQLLPQDIIAQTDNFSEITNYTNSQWAQLYYSHALYYTQAYNATGDESNLADALELKYLADTFDQFLSQARPLVQAPSNGQPNSTSLPQVPTKPQLQVAVTNSAAAGPFADAKPLLAGLAIIIVIAGAAIYLSGRRRAYGYPEYPHGESQEDYARRLGLLEDALLENRISERTYLDLKAKLSGKAQTPSQARQVAPKRPTRAPAKARKR